MMLIMKKMILSSSFYNRKHRVETLCEKVSSFQDYERLGFRPQNRKLTLSKKRPKTIGLRISKQGVVLRTLTFFKNRKKAFSPKTESLRFPKKDTVLRTLKS